MNSTDIINTAYRWRNYKYWYGASGQIATQALADQLKQDYPAVWTDSYYETALQDIDSHTRVGDCSAMVSACYQLGYHMSTAEMRGYYPAWTGAPKPGMIIWRTGHCGVFNNNEVIAMRSQALDWGIVPYNPIEWEYTLYDPHVIYADEPVPPGPGPSPGGRFPILFFLYKGKKGGLFL